jgi:Ni,Fe-hydrogenase I large subunit
MEQQLDSQSNYDPSTGHFQDLQPLLRRTYEREMAYVSKKREEYSNEMKAARDFVSKLTKKQSSFFNSIKLATGTTIGTANIDQKIFQLK